MIENLTAFIYQIGIILLLPLILYLVVVIATLIHQAKRKRWVWFVLTILQLPFIVLLYWFIWIVSPEFRATKPK